jgi:hypothetical protein
MSECPEGMVIQLLPKYAAIGTFENEMTDVHIFIYDSQDNCVSKVNVDGPTLAANKYKVQVPISEGDYHLVVWNGLEDTTNYSEESAAVTLKTESDNSTSNTFEPLWHGQASDVTVEKLSLTTVEVPMIKDTNNYVVFLCATDGTALDPNDFDFKITSENGAMARDNSLLASPQITYNDYSLTQEEVEGSLDLDLVSASSNELGLLPMVRSELNSLRLTTEKPSYLTIINKKTSRAILKINLNDYILKAFRTSGSTISAQEYFDTEDLFNLTFFLTLSNNDNPGTVQEDYQYFCVAIKINDWVIRYQEFTLQN